MKITKKGDFAIFLEPFWNFTLKMILAFHDNHLEPKITKCEDPLLERTYKPHYHYQNFSPLANGTDLNREKYAILQTHWH